MIVDMVTELRILEFRVRKYTAYLLKHEISPAVMAISLLHPEVNVDCMVVDIIPRFWGAHTMTTKEIFVLNHALRAEFLIHKQIDPTLAYQSHSGVLKCIQNNIHTLKVITQCINEVRFAMDKESIKCGLILKLKKLSLRVYRMYDKRPSKYVNFNNI